MAQKAQSWAKRNGMYWNPLKIQSGYIWVCVYRHKLNKEKFFPFKFDLKRRLNITVFLNTLKHSEIVAQQKHLLLLNMIEQLDKEEGNLSWWFVAHFNLHAHGWEHLLHLWLPAQPSETAVRCWHSKNLIQMSNCHEFCKQMVYWKSTGRLHQYTSVQHLPASGLLHGDPV